MQEITSDFFKREPLTVCKELIGCTIERTFEDGQKITGVISEIEAYLGEHDKASHTYKCRKTNRTKTMFLDGGTMYVYFIYGMHYNLNFVTQQVGTPSGILLRGIMVTNNHDLASKNRYGTSYDNLTKTQKNNLSNGPGKVCQMLKIHKENDAMNFNEIFKIYKPDNYSPKYKTTPRINIEYAQEHKHLPYRYVLE